MKPSRIFMLSTVSVLIFLTAYIPFCHNVSDRIIEETKFYMGTIVQIKVSINPKDDEMKARKDIDEAFKEIGRVENVFSTFKPYSEISKINRLKPNEGLMISDEAFWLIKKSIDYNKKTQGVFDITVKPLIDLWERAKRTKIIPKDEEIKEALTKVGSDYISLNSSDKTISFTRSGMGIDLGGVAKGYAADRAIKILRENGIKNAIVASGGDMYCLGRKSRRQTWKVGIQHPRNRNEILLKLALEDKSINTSGDYERFFVLNNRRYSHIIDPRTGYPIGDNVVSATVIAEDSATSDILATALCILGHKGLSIIKTMKGVDAILIINSNNTLIMEMSEGSKERYGISEKTAIEQ